MARIDGNPTVSILLSTSTTCPLPFKFGSGYKIRVKAASEDTDSVVDWFSKNYPAPERVLTSPDSDICELKFKAGDLKLSEAFAKLEEVCCLRVGSQTVIATTRGRKQVDLTPRMGYLAQVYFLQDQAVVAKVSAR